MKTRLLSGLVCAVLAYVAFMMILSKRNQYLKAQTTPAITITQVVETVVIAETESDQFAQPIVPETGTIVRDRGAQFSYAPVTQNPPRIVTEEEVRAMQKNGKR